MELKGYLTNLGKYNEGKLIGKWVTFPITDEELNEALKAIGCTYVDENDVRQNPFYEEFFFTDWDTCEDIKLGEYESISRLNEIAETVNGFTGYEERVFIAANELYSLDEALNVNSFMLLEDVHDDYDLGYYYAEESGCYEIDESNPLRRYIDYAAFGRDIRIEADGGFTSYGFLERD